MRARKPRLVNAAPQSGHTSPLPWTLEEDAYGTNIIAADGSRVAYVHSCSCNGQADADAELLVSAPVLKAKVGVLGDEKRSLLGNLEDQANATAAQKRCADEAVGLLKELWRLCCASRGDTPAHRDIDDMNKAWDAVRDFLARGGT